MFNKKLWEKIKELEGKYLEIISTVRLEDRQAIPGRIEGLEERVNSISHSQAVIFRDIKGHDMSKNPHDIVFCEECGVAFNRLYGKTIREVITNDDGHWVESGYKHYCDRHKPEYDEVRVGTDYKEYYKNMIGVNEKGKVIKK